MQAQQPDRQPDKAAGARHPTLERLRTIPASSLPFLVFLAVGVILSFPLLGLGFVFTMDLRPDFLYSEHALYGLYESAHWWTAKPLILFIELLKGMGFPLEAFQKLLLLSIFTLAGLGGYRLLRGRHEIARYFAGLVYAINPYVYSRLIVGQWNHVLGYALMPFALLSFLDGIKGKASALITSVLLATLIGALSVQSVFFVWLVFLIIGGGWFISQIARGERQEAWAGAKRITLCVIAYVSVNVYWLMPAMSAQGTELSDITWQDMAFFAPNSTTGLGVPVDVFLLHGSWHVGFLDPADVLPLSIAASIAVAALSVYAVTWYQMSNRSKWLVWSFVSLFIVSFVLACGFSLLPNERTAQTVFRYTSWLSPLRDSGRFIGILALSYAFLGGVGADALLKSALPKKYLSKYVPTLLSLFLLALPFTSTPTLFNGFWGQVRPTPYPAEWLAAKDYVEKQGVRHSILFLPWHWFVTMHWLPNTPQMMLLDAPARPFFGQATIQNDDPELTFRPFESTDPVSRYVTFLVRHGHDTTNLGELLALVDIKYVVLAKEADYRDYWFLERQQDLRKVVDNGLIALYEVRHETSRVYSVSKAQSLSTWLELLEHSQWEDLTDSLHILDGDQPSEWSPSSEMADQATDVQFVEESPVRYRLNAGDSGYIILAPTQRSRFDGWEYNGKQPVVNVGATLAWTASGGGEIVYTRFYRTYLPAYVASGMSTILLLVGFLLFKRREQMNTQTSQCGLFDESHSTPE